MAADGKEEGGRRKKGCTNERLCWLVGNRQNIGRVGSEISVLFPISGLHSHTFSTTNTFFSSTFIQYLPRNPTASLQDSNHTRVPAVTASWKPHHPSGLQEGRRNKMSRDPYHDFASDLKSSLSSARSLSQSYRQLLQSSSSTARASSSSGGEVDSAYDRLSDAIEGLRQDVEDVKQSVLVVERSGPERFGVTPEELKRRKEFVAECEAEIDVSCVPSQTGIAAHG